MPRVRGIHLSTRTYGGFYVQTLLRHLPADRQGMRSMSENKYTPEPWRAFNNGEGVVGVGTDHSDVCWTRIEEGGWLNSDRTIDTDYENARRIVACVNACVGCATEVLETAPVGFFNSTYGHPKYLEEIAKAEQRVAEACALQVATETKFHWLDAARVAKEIRSGEWRKFVKEM